MEIDRNLKAIRDLTEEGVSHVHPKLAFVGFLVSKVVPMPLKR